MSPSSDRRYIEVVGWEKFQHYSDRSPVWIKNYVALLHKDEYRKLTGEQRGILHGLWLEYASSAAQLALDTRSLSSRLALRVTTPQLEALSDAGFIRFRASKPLARRYQAASADKEVERERARARAPAPARASSSPQGPPPTNSAPKSPPPVERVYANAEKWIDTLGAEYPPERLEEIIADEFRALADRPELIAALAERARKSPSSSPET